MRLLPWVDEQLVRTDAHAVALWLALTCVAFGLWQQTVWAGVWLFAASTVVLKGLGAWLAAELQVFDPDATHDKEDPS